MDDSCGSGKTRSQGTRKGSSQEHFDGIEGRKTRTGQGCVVSSIIDFHVKFERIHPFQDGNGRVGRLVMLKECLKYGHTPFVIAENIRQFYYLGLQDWNDGRQARLKDTCGTGQDVFKLGLKNFGYGHLVKEGEL